MPLESFSPPGNLDDLDAAGRQAWSDWISRHFDAARAGRPDELEFDGPREQFYNPTKVETGADAARADITWTAFPRNVRIDSLGDGQRWTIADGNRHVQDEYCEWSVERDGASGKIRRITFTCEGPEYWEFLAAVDPQKTLDLYREFVSPDVRAEHLFDSSGDYRPQNRWNRDSANGAMHLIQVNNSLSAEIELAGGASVVREKNGQLLTDTQELIECGGYGDPERNSDPHIGAQVNSFTRQKADVTLADPVGLYFHDLVTAGWAAPDGTDPKAFWKRVRGSEGHAVRVVFEVPADRDYLVGDIMIQDRPIEFGAQVADFIQMKLTGVATRIGQSQVAPMTGCRRKRAPLTAAVGGTPSVKDVLDRARRGR